MIIEQVDIINFKKYSQEKIHLGKRIVGIFGPNGSGKSTIFDAICWCLYGVTPTIGKEGQSVKQSELMRDGQEDMGVEVTFIYDGQIYRVHRFLRKDGITAAVRLENELVARSSKEVTSYITKTLGLDAKAFISASFIRQNEIDLLTSQRSSKRKEIINRLFNLQLYDQFLYDAKDKRRACEADIARKEEEIKGIKREMEHYSDILVNETSIDGALKGHEKHIVSLGNDIRKYDDERTRLEVELEELRRHERKLSELSAKKEALVKAIEKERRVLTEAEASKSRLPAILKEMEGIEKKRAKLESLQPVRDRTQELSYILNGLKKELETARHEGERALQGLSERISTAQRGREEILSNVSSLASEIEDYRGRMSDHGAVEAELGDIADEIEKIGGRMSLEKQEMARFSALIEKISKEGDVYNDLSKESRCPTCKQHLDEDLKRKLVEQNAEERTNFISKLQRVKNKISKLQALLDDRTLKREGLTKLLNDDRAIMLEISTKNMELDRLNKDLTKADKDLKSLGDERKRLEGYHGEKAARAEEKIQEIRAEFETLEFSEEDFVSLKEEVKGYEVLVLSKERLENLVTRADEARQELSRAEGELEALEREVKSQQAMVSGIKALKSKIVKIGNATDVTRDELSRLQVEAGKLSQQIESNASIRSRKRELKKLLKDRETDLAALKENSKQYGTLSEAFKNIPINVHERLKPLIQMEVSGLLNSITQGKYPAVMIDEEYTVQVSFNGIFYPIYRFSGGEKDLINLCLRIGISRVLVSLSKEQGFAHLESLFLDETFSSLDSERRMNLMAVLNKLEGFFSQIVIITHVEDIKEMIPQAILVEEDEDGTAKVYQS
ncbi:MAG TPA: SMC family ATPase [Candidatus Methanofastidiosa archaeon]|nr:SMC family ATPase [Candidatus Methanofastidiosa archaeon]